MVMYLTMLMGVSDLSLMSALLNDDSYCITVQPSISNTWHPVATGQIIIILLPWTKFSPELYMQTCDTIDKYSYMYEQECRLSVLRHAGTTKVLATVDEDKPNNCFNDGKCDGLGRLWCGSGERILRWEGNKPVMPTPNMAALHCYSAGYM